MHTPKILILETPEEVAQTAAKLVEKELSKKPKSIVGFPTGATMIPFYKELTKKSLSKIKAFNIDEYVSLPKSSKNSFYYFLEKNLYSKSNISKSNINSINGAAENPNLEATNYEKKIIESGCDILILGLGVNAHIAFNEPGSTKNSKTRLIKLTKETISHNKKFFKSQKVPTKAITIGISTILKSKKIILLAFGKSKRQALHQTLFRKISSKVPASFLRLHKDVTIIVDRAAFPKSK